MDFVVEPLFLTLFHYPKEMSLPTTKGINMCHNSFDVRTREISPALEEKSQVNSITLKRRNTPASVRKVESNNCVARRPKV
mmetsp:Transcript_3288/g.5419  ORF Transcript_3288/g.5419 Transcript_3288/m.5419 type:complete len:81 (-) Transcript_3288:90-332(-)